MGKRKVKKEEVVQLIARLFENQRFAADEPLKAGGENEGLIVNPKNLGRMSGSAELVRRLSERPDWTQMFDASSDMLVATMDPSRRITVTMDAGLGTYELVFVETGDLYALGSMISTAERLAVEAAAEDGHVLLGLGRQPVARSNWNTWHPKRRYQGLQKLLRDGGHETTETASTQTTVDARDLARQIDMVNIGCALAGPLAAITANSPLFHGQAHRDNVASRLMTWNRIVHPDQRGRVGIPNTPFTDVEHYATALADLSFLFNIEEDGSATVYNLPFWQAVLQIGGAQWREALHQLLLVHIACVWWDARARLTSTAAVEFRVPCAQPQGESIAVHALHVGLAENVDEAVRLVGEYDWADWQVARFDCAHHGLRASVAARPITEIVTEMLRIAVKGLKSRGKHEERLLDPLFDRLSRGETPADLAIRCAEQSGVESILGERSFTPDTSAA